jgi:SAM-dependent methyltransferase
MRRLAASGADLDGEARFVDAVVARGARILDAGCGTGRVGAALLRRGHTVIGVDADPVLIEAAREDHPDGRWLLADLACLELPDRFDAAVMAGNVLPYVAPGTETAVLSRVAAHLAPDGLLVVGFGVDRGYPVAAFDRHIAEAGLRAQHRFATWQLAPWTPDAPFLVSVLRPSD